MFCNVDGAAVLLLTVPVGSCSCEAAELSFSCLRRLKTWSKRGRRVRRKATTFTVLWTNQTLSLCLLCFATLAAITAVCEIFNLLHFWSTAQRGAWPKWPNGKYASGYEVGCQLLLITTDFRLVPTSMTWNDLKRRTSLFWFFFQRIRQIFRPIISQWSKVDL